MKLNNLSEAERELAKYIPLTKEITGKDITLDRMRPLMQHLGDPQEKLKIIHIAGTSGKTSTSYFIAGLLKQSGNKVGLTVSPHIGSVTERVQVNGKPLSDSEFCKELAIFLDIIQGSPIQPTYFELLVAFAYWYFAKTNVDYAVIETGLGGLHDATNIAGLPNKICVVTDIGIDHTKILGSTIKEISKQKAGIIYQHNEVYMYDQSSEVMSVFKAVCISKKANLNVLSDNATLALSNLPLYQQRNWLLAEFVYKSVARRDNLPALTLQQLQDTQKITVPGRMETKKIDAKTVVLDGAHNEQKMQALVASYQQRFPGHKATIVLSLKFDKAYQSVFPILKPICDKLIITKFQQAQDLPAKPVPTEELLVEAQKAGYKNITVEPVLGKALQLALQTKSKQVLVTGSLYLVSDSKEQLEQN